MLLELDKSNLDLAIAELQSIAKKIEVLEEGIVIAKIKNPQLLGMTKNAYEVLGTIKKMKKIKGSFKAISHDKISNKEFAKLIWDNTSKQVNLKNPENEIHLFRGLVTKKVHERSLGKKSHEWKHNHPTSTDPKISRAMINIARTKKVYDPFCGAGGILIEAGLMGYKTEGVDIDKKQIIRAKENLQAFNIKAKLRVGNSFTENWPEVIVTDLPYGRNSKIQKGFFEKFFKKIKECKRAVIGIPANIIIPNELIKFETEIYLHKSLTKKIILLEH